MDLWQFTPLHEAASKNRVEVCSLLLAHGADPALLNCHSKSAVDMAPAAELKERLSCECPAPCVSLALWLSLPHLTPPPHPPPLPRRVQRSLAAAGGPRGRRGEGEEDAGAGDHRLQAPAEQRDGAGKEAAPPPADGGVVGVM